MPRDTYVFLGNYTKKVDSFSAVISSWHDFYALIGTASATLVGLLFVALSINSHILTDTTYSDMKWLAGRTFYCFLYLMILSATMLVPHQDRNDIGGTLILVGSLGLGSAALSLYRDPNITKLINLKRVLGQSVFLVMALLIIIVTGALVLNNDVDSLIWLTWAVLILVVAGTNNAWDLFVQMRKQD